MSEETTKHLDAPHLTPPSAEAVRMQMERILADPAFEANPRRKAMFRYLVEETTIGRGELLKGFTVATAVFGRDQSFDPQSDPIVRIEARRLRSDLDGYYAGKGHGDRLRIVIPKGRYQPLAYWQADPAPAEPLGFVEPLVPDASASALVPTIMPRKTAATVLVGVLLMLVAVIAHSLWSKPGTNAADAGQATSVPVMVLPFGALGTATDTASLSEGLTQELIADLMRFSGLQLYTANASFRQSPSADAAELAKELGVAYIVRGSVSIEGDKLRVIADLEEAVTGRILWSKSADSTMTPGALIATRSYLAQEIASQLGQTYGVIKTDVFQTGANPQSGELSSYLCILQAQKYRRTFDTELYGPALSCLEAATAQDPTYADAWGLLGWLRMDAVRFDLTPADAKSAAMQAASSAAERAIKLDPENLVGLQALAAIDYYGGEFDTSEHLMRQVLQLNPNDPDSLVQFGWRLAARGKWDEGIALVERGIARTMNPPGWYFHAIAVHDYLAGDYAGAIASAERSAKNGSGVGLAIVAAAEAQRGDLQAAQTALKQLAEADPEMNADPVKVFQTHQVITPTLDALIEGLKKAGWSAR